VLTGVFISPSTFQTLREGEMESKRLDQEEACGAALEEVRVCGFQSLPGMEEHGRKL